MEIFAGSGRVANTWRRRGGSALAVDARHGPREDVLDPRVGQGILRAIGRHLVDAVWLVGRPGPLRTLEHISGVPAALACEADRARIVSGNQNMSFSATCIAACLRHGAPVAIENPASTRLWHVSPIVSLVQLPSADSVVTDMCQHGASYGKRTRVVMWNACWPHGWAPTCASSSGRCTRTGTPREMLRGSAGGETRTASAATYPLEFATKAAAVLWH